MNINFEFILFSAVVISGSIVLFDIVYRVFKRQKSYGGVMIISIVNHARSFFLMLLLIFLGRSFLFEPFRIPSGSLQPTLLIGDFILANKFDYGIRLPILRSKVFSISEPRRGDVVVFHGVDNPNINLIKRVIGVPGDHLSYVNKILYINGKEIFQQFKMATIDLEGDGENQNVIEKQENLLGIKHDIYLNPNYSNQDFHDIVVPQGKYFVMGDNRDNSADSRVFGFLPDENIIGKATRILISFDSLRHPIRWGRVGRQVNPHI